MLRGNVHLSERGNVHESSDVLISIGSTDVVTCSSIDSDEHGEYVELCFDDDMAGVILDEDQHVGYDEIATLRVYLSSAANKKEQLWSRKTISSRRPRC